MSPEETGNYLSLEWSRRDFYFTYRQHNCSISALKQLQKLDLHRLALKIKEDDICHWGNKADEKHLSHFSVPYLEGSQDFAGEQCTSCLAFLWAPLHSNILPSFASVFLGYQIPLHSNRNVGKTAWHPYLAPMTLQDSLSILK